MSLRALISKCMFEPVNIITLGVIEPVVRASTLCTGQSAVYGCLSTVEEEAQFNGLDQLRVKCFAFVLHLYSLIGFLQAVDAIEGMVQALIAALNKDFVIHFVLQRTAYVRRRCSTGRGIEASVQLTGNGLGFWGQWSVGMRSD